MIVGPTLDRLLTQLVELDIPRANPDIFRELQSLLGFDRGTVLIPVEGGSEFHVLEADAPWGDQWRRSSRRTAAPALPGEPTESRLDPASGSDYERSLAGDGYTRRILLPVNSPRRDRVDAGIELLYRDDSDRSEPSLGEILEILGPFYPIYGHFLVDRLHHDREERHVREAQLFREAAITISSSLSTEEVVDKILVFLKELVPYNTSSVQVLRDKEGRRILEIIGGAGFSNLSEIVGLTFEVGGDNPNTIVIDSRKTYVSDDISRSFENFTKGPHKLAGIQSWMGVPMIIGDKLIGMLTLDYNIAGFYTSRHVRIAEVFAIQAAAALANAALFEDLAKHVEALKESEDRLREANAELQRLSMTDELTGLYNRRGFMMLAERFLDSNRRNNIQSVLVYIDLDHLKRINDTHGHDAGDRAIIRFAEILERTLRKSDVGARIGGDEFAFITGVPEPDAVDRILERLDGALAEFNASGEDVFTLSATGGSAFIDVDSDASLEDGLREADENLYRKKQARR